MSRFRLIGIPLVLCAVVSLAAPAEAQRGEGRGMRGVGMGGEMMQVMQFAPMLEAAIEHASEIGLEDEPTLVTLADMKLQVDEVFAPLQERLLALRQGGRPERAAMRSLMEEAQEALRPHMERFGELVTEEQREALREFLPSPRRGGGMSG